LIGGPPNDLPRPGESLNLEGTLGLWEMFGDFSEYFFTKYLVVGYVGDYVLTCDFNVAQQPRTRTLLQMLGYTAPHGFLHLDRIGLDAALYRHVVANELCTVVDGRVASLDHDPATDRLRAIHLADGSVIEPSYVFDATNHGRLVAQAADVGIVHLSRPQRTVFTHYRASHLRADGAVQEPWEHASNLLRLFADSDGLDALTWCIPIGDYVSIGVSVDGENTAPSDEDLLAAAERAFAARGLHYRARFDQPTTVMPLRHQYFMHQRSYGANWLLVGPSACQIWWMSGSGVGAGFAAAQVAAQVLQDPQGVGRTYSDYMKMLMGTHDVFDWFARVEHADVTAEGVALHADGFIRGNVMRLAKSWRTRQSLGASLIGDATYVLARHELVARKYCPVFRAPLADQTKQIFERADQSAA
jgi:hypothetical protein